MNSSRTRQPAAVARRDNNGSAYRRSEVRQPGDKEDKDEWICPHALIDK